MYCLIMILLCENNNGTTDTCYIALVLILPSDFLDWGGQSHGCISKGFGGLGYGTSSVTNSANNTNIAGSKI